VTHDSCESEPVSVGFDPQEGRQFVWHVR